ncbi:hypothetical protein OKA06_19210 [Novosphingobium sp. MW5]|nr:hypothetical protein [Novosphingobium sp. MW5]
MDIARFESLGDNCEFGFVMARHQPKRRAACCVGRSPLSGVDQTAARRLQGSLSVRKPGTDQPQDVAGSGTGVRFHTDMVRDSVFVEDHKAVYEKEIHKVAHLRQRLEEQPEPGHDLCLQRSPGAAQAELQTLADLVSRRGGAQLLYVTAKGDLPPGSVEAHGDNLHIARIDRFADYATANVTSEAVWDQILENASIKIARAHAQPATCPGASQQDRKLREDLHRRTSRHGWRRDFASVEGASGRG